MADRKISQEIETLRKEIRRHDNLYYVKDQPEISDFEYDNLLKKLITLEEENPSLKTLDSPSQRIGGKATASFNPVKHSIPMLSLDNTYSEEEFRDWYKRILKTFKEDTIELVVELKIDGVGASLAYRDGLLEIGATRGDGEIGENITPNIKTIRSVPLKLQSDKSPKHFEVRGEVYIDKKDFAKLNDDIISTGEQPFANSRNAAAGSLRQKNSSITASRPLKFLAHSYGETDKIFDNHWDFLQYCDSLGLKPPYKTKVFKDINQLIAYKTELENMRDKIPFEVDGIVIKINSIKKQKILGFTAKSPRWAVAFKFKARTATTRIDNIRVQVGRTGTITPVADLKPVELSGVTISRATLHNFDEIDRLDARIGDTVLIERAGDVIPKVVKVITSKRKGSERKYQIPKNCPICGTQILKETEEEVAYRCINPSCTSQIEKGLTHFASRDAMDIEGFGDIVVEQLVKNKMVLNFADIYSLKEEDFLKLDLFKEKKAQNLVNAIGKSKKQQLNKLIYAFGIRHVGEKAAWVLATRFKNIDTIMALSIEKLVSINEIGPVMAKSIVDFFNQSAVKILIKNLKNENVNTKQSDIEGRNQSLAGKTLVLTGELSSISRSDAELRIRELGGNPSSSVSKKTDFVVVGENPGSKYDKAKKLGVKILKEKEFISLMEKNSE
ncbi:NAD-dependent DNA ligase LigA [Elusimicrobiota bacterium]